MKLAKFLTYLAANDDPQVCWEWPLFIGTHGYGAVDIDGVRTTAHRAAYLATVGPIPAGYQIDHLCRNRPCFNPSHLEAVTPRENTLRSESTSARNARKTECHNGHPFDEANTYIRVGRGRECRSCHKEKELVRKRRLGVPPMNAAAYCIVCRRIFSQRTDRQARHDACVEAFLGSVYRSEAS